MQACIAVPNPRIHASAVRRQAAPHSLAPPPGCTSCCCCAACSLSCGRCLSTSASTSSPNSRSRLSGMDLTISRQRRLACGAGRGGRRQGAWEDEQAWAIYRPVCQWPAGCLRATHVAKRGVQRTAQPCAPLDSGSASGGCMAALPAARCDPAPAGSSPARSRARHHCMRGQGGVGGWVGGLGRGGGGHECASLHSARPRTGEGR